MDSNTRVFKCEESLWKPCNELASRLNITMDGLICEALTFYYQQQAAALQNGSFFPVSPANACLPATSQDILKSSYAKSHLGGGGASTFSNGASQLPFERSAAPAVTSQPNFTARGLPNVPGSVAPAIPNVPGSSPLPPPSIPPSLPNSAQRSAPPAPPRRPPSLFDDSDAPKPNGAALNLASLSSPHMPPIAQPPAHISRPAAPPVALGLGGASTGMPPLYVVFANQRYLVSKDKYIIGRSSQVADLVIRDGNISRKHCAVVYKNGSYYITDLGSTNGLEYQGQQIKTKRIDEGDQFNICEFVFKFTYR